MKKLVDFKCYAVKKMYVKDERYKKYLKDIQYLIDNKDKFKYLAEIIYKII